MIIFLTVFCLGCDIGSGPGEGSGTVRLVSISPGGPYTANQTYNFTVEVGYTLLDVQEAQIVVGFGSRASDGSTSTAVDVEDLTGPAETEVIKSYSFSKKLYNSSPDENILRVSLKPYPVTGVYSPYDSENQVVTVTVP